jgi:CheY-like chemotaxis protein
MAPDSSLQGSEAILVVEDSLQVRTLIHDVLEAHGYRVFAAPSAREALEIAGRPGVQFDLLLTDIDMPEMNGRELADTLSARQPGLKVVFVSGYGSDELARHGVTPGAALLQKPFGPKVLARTVRETLDLRP